MFGEAEPCVKADIALITRGHDVDASNTLRCETAAQIFNQMRAEALPACPGVKIDVQVGGKRVRVCCEILEVAERIETR